MNRIVPYAVIALALLVLVFAARALVQGGQS